jgi:O-antigen ligase
MNSPLRASLLDRAAFALLCLFVFSMPWEKSLWVPGVGTLTRLFGILAFASFAVVVLRRRSLRPPNLALVWAALFVLWAAGTWLWSYDRAATAARAGTFAELLAMLWLVWDSCRSAPRQLRLMQAYVWGAVAACGDALVRYFVHQQTYYRRYAAAGFDPNDFGLILALAIPMALYLSLRARGRSCWLYRAAVLTILAGVLLTASRTALIAAFVAFGFALFTWRAADLSQRVSSVVLLALLVLGVVQLAPAHARERLSTISTELRQGTLHDRTRIWKSGLRAFVHRPVRGVGAGAYPAAVRPWLGVPGIPGHQYVAHNTFLSVLVECGAVGFGIYALLLGTLILFIWMMPPTERALWSITLAVWAVGVSTLTWEQYKPTWLVFALILTEWERAFWPAPKQA